MSIFDLDKRVPTRSATQDYSGAVTETMGKPQETGKTSDAAAAVVSAAVFAVSILVTLLFTNWMPTPTECMYLDDWMRMGFE
jgi:hypothetical protein